MANKTQAELVEALKLLPYNKNWKGLYGSPGQISYRYRRIYMTDFVVGLIYAPDNDSLAFHAARNIVTDIKDGVVFYDMYFMGEKRHSSENEISKYYQGLIVLEEQTEDVLYQLYKKNVFESTYGKTQQEEIKALKHQQYLDIKDNVEQLIIEGRIKIEITENNDSCTIQAHIDGRKLTPMRVGVKELGATLEWQYIFWHNLITNPPIDPSDDLKLLLGNDYLKNI